VQSAADIFMHSGGLSLGLPDEFHFCTICGLFLVEKSLFSEYIRQNVYKTQTKGLVALRLSKHTSRLFVIVAECGSIAVNF
jgi:hypothetical protein